MPHSSPLPQSSPFASLLLFASLLPLPTQSSSISSPHPYPCLSSLPFFLPFLSPLQCRESVSELCTGHISSIPFTYTTSFPGALRQSLTVQAASELVLFLPQSLLDQGCMSMASSILLFVMLLCMTTTVLEGVFPQPKVYLWDTTKVST